MSVSGTPRPTPRSPPRRVLEDASGRRLRRMRWVGRATALLFLAWLALVILGGLGVGPVARLPLGNVLRPSAGPPPSRHVPKPAPPAAADLVPALPAVVPARPAPVPGATTTTRTATHGKSALAPGQTKTTTTTATLLPGRSGAAPGHTKTTTTPGKSAGAPGHVKHTTTTTTTTTTTKTTVPGKKLGHGKKP
jgi:hypothetical protein